MKIWLDVIPFIDRFRTWCWYFCFPYKSLRKSFPQIKLQLSVSPNLCHWIWFDNVRKKIKTHEFLFRGNTYLFQILTGNFSFKSNHPVCEKQQTDHYRHSFQNYYFKSSFIIIVFKMIWVETNGPRNEFNLEII